MVEYGYVVQNEDGTYNAYFDIVTEDIGYSVGGCTDFPNWRIDGRYLNAIYYDLKTHLFSYVKEVSLNENDLPSHFYDIRKDINTPNVIGFGTIYSGTAGFFHSGD